MKTKTKSTETTFPLTLTEDNPALHLLANESHKEFGFKATVTMKEPIGSQGITELCLRNLTEVNWKFVSSGTAAGVAFESDIHYTGCSHHVSAVSKVVVELETVEVARFQTDVK